MLFAADTSSTTLDIIPIIGQFVNFNFIKLSSRSFTRKKNEVSALSCNRNFAPWVYFRPTWLQGLIQSFQMAIKECNDDLHHFRLIPVNTAVLRIFHDVAPSFNAMIDKCLLQKLRLTW